MLYYIFFGANVPFAIGIALWPIVHYWSLGVEEQFYLFWPWIVKKTSLKSIIYVILAIMVVWVTCKILLWTPADKSPIFRFFAITRFDCMMIGALGAVLYYQRKKWFLKLAQNKWIASIAVLLLIFSQWLKMIPAIIQPQVIAVVSLVAIVGQLSEQKPLINLEIKIMDGIGKISYGIYVIHPLLIWGLSIFWQKLNLNLSVTMQVVIIYALVTVATLVVAQLSYWFLERPFLKIKDRFAVVQSRSSMSK